MRCARCTVEADGQVLEMIGFQGDLVGVLHSYCLDETVAGLCREKPEYVSILWQLVQYEETHSPDQWAIDITRGKRDACWEAHKVGVAGRNLSYLADSHIATVVFKSNSSTAYSLVNRQVTKQALEQFERATEGNIALIHMILPNELCIQARASAKRVNSSLTDWIESAVVEKIERDY